MALNPEGWMEELWPVIRDQKLCDVVLPGCHDAGMGVLSRNFPPGSGFVHQCATRTQSFPIATQLARGSRLFELRPALVDGVLYFCHGVFGNEAVQVKGAEAYFLGSLGEKVEDALRAVKQFAQGHPRELVILRFSFMFHILPLPGHYASDVEKTAFRDWVVTLIGDVLIQSKEPKLLVADQTLAQLLNEKGRNVLCCFDEEGFGTEFAEPQKGVFSRGKDASPSANVPFQSAVVDRKNPGALKDAFRGLADGCGVSLEVSWHGNFSLSLSQVLAWMAVPSTFATIALDCLANQAAQLAGLLGGAMSEWIREDVITRSKRPGVIWFDYFDSHLLETIAFLNTVLRGPVTGWSAAAGDRIGPGEGLAAGGTLWSKNHKYKLVMQNDGNLVLYAAGSPDRDLWASKTKDCGLHPRVCLMQSDGRLVVYDDNGKPLWDSGTSVRDSILVVQNDGNLVVDGPARKGIWASNDQR